jgi:hypothetical protein
VGGSLELVDLGGGRGRLALEPGRSLHRIDRQIGHLLDINEALRTRAKQQRYWDDYQAHLAGGPWAPIAAHPDDTERARHLIGYAIDTDEQITAVLNDHGWFHTVYRWVNGVYTLVEPWHYEYDPNRDNHRHEHVALVRGADGIWRLEEDELNDDERRMLKELHDRVTVLWTAQRDADRYGRKGTVVERLEKQLAGLVDSAKKTLERVTVLYDSLRDADRYGRKGTVTARIDAAIEDADG